MTDSKIIEEIRERLRPFVNNDRLADYAVYDESIEDLILMAQYAQVEEEFLAEVKMHPEGLYMRFVEFFEPYDGDYVGEDEDDE